ncbi:ATP-dependent DNA helicase [Helicobacter sp. 13S00401-1]|uniref:ATP-dependent helicase n=1 Tax=Helicobacter sp. 13S00401-1 TaxID=1905758 RepID=UPI000BA732EF|nr:ATP-dependent helicase [Helicobacter sp. 13S00401-1]PAF51372.1 ATP-dependent DNA helicase [Helicobacter sp. 13S00401-1]
MLNEEQLAAINAPLGHNLIIASAGTGKTSTIVNRIKHLLTLGIAPSKILLLTFTNKASKEMIARLENLTSKDVAQSIHAGTFHGVAYKYLKETRHISLKTPRELKMLFKSIYDKYLLNNKEAYSYQHLYDSYSFYINSAFPKSFSDFLESKNTKSEGGGEFSNIYERLFLEFNDLKKSYNYADYNDLLVFYREEVLNKRLNNEVLFTEVLCDEYQDTNPLQYSILKALSPQSLFCVGDYDQSIYGFNGADIQIITDFTKDFSDAKVYSLNKNYRSSEHILELANTVIEHNPRIYPKRLEVIKKGEFNKPKLLVYEDLYEQYNAISKIIANAKMEHDDIAIIYRNNASADGLQACLRAVGVASKRRGSSSFFDSKEIGLCLNICAILANPKDVMGFLHVLDINKAISSNVAKDIFDALLKLGNGDIIQGLLRPATNNNPYNTTSLFEESKIEVSRLKDEFKTHPILKHSKLTTEGALHLQNLYLLFKGYSTFRELKYALGYIYNSEFVKGYVDFLSTSRARQKDGSINESLKEESLSRIKVRFDLLQQLSSNYTDMKAFLNMLTMDSSEASVGKGVNLLSVHASKGLEFECVFVIDLMQGRFPNLKLMAKSGSLEEERRLFYVAATRAKSRLILSYAKFDRYKNIDYKPSIFLKEARLIDTKAFF